MDLVKTCNFPNKVPCFYVSMNFSANSCKNCLISWESTKTHRFGQNYATFSNKLPCFGVSMNFSAKDCKKWLNSWKSRKNHRFGQNFATSRGNYHVFAFRSTFQEKVVRSASFRRKARKIIDLAKSLWLFEQTTMSLHFDELFRKKLQKVPHFVKKHENPSIWQKLATFRENYHVLTFRWTLQQKVAKSCSCREKARKVINLAKSLQLFEQTSMFLHFDEFSRKKLPKVLRFVKKHEKSSIWPKLCNFSSRLPCFGISMKFSAKSYKQCLISWKSTKNRRFGENSQLFQQTTMFWRFGELFSEKLQKVLRFLRKLYKSSIGPKLATFSNKVPCLCVSMNFSAKGASFREKARKIIDLPKTCNFSNKLPCCGISMIIAGKSCKKVEKVAHFVKNDEKSSIWPKLATFRGNYHVSAFLSTFQQKVSHFVKKHEKSSFGSCLAHS